MAIGNINEKQRDKKIRKLSLTFVKDVSYDIAKSPLIPVKIILEGVTLWPGIESFRYKAINWFMIFNLCCMEYGHAAYLFYNITDVPKMASVCTTVSTTFQTICKIATLRIFKTELNQILCSVWDDFWPSDIASEVTKRNIKVKMFFVKAFCFMCLGSALVSCYEFMASPLIKKSGSLPLESKFPFDYKPLPVYELLYVWQCFNNFTAVCIVSGYDFLFAVVMMNCVGQFQILQDVLENIYNVDDKKLRKKIFGKLEIREDDAMKETILFMKCVRHHLKILKICKEMESIFTFVIFVQYFISIIALCVSNFVLITTPSQAWTMLSYAAAHMLQLILYSTIGSELIYQSQHVSSAVFKSGWATVHNKTLRHGLLMMIERAKRPSQLTALGFVELSYRSLLMVLRLSFSFYTMLDFLMKNKYNVVH